MPHLQRHTSEESVDVERPTCSIKLANTSYVIALPGSFLVFVLYWLLVFPTRTAAQQRDIHPITVLVHGVNFFVMLVDASINAQPFPLAHGLYFLVYALIYLLWSILFVVAGLRVRCTCSDDDREKGCKGKFVWSTASCWT